MTKYESTACLYDEDEEYDDWFEDPCCNIEIAGVPIDTFSLMLL